MQVSDHRRTVRRPSRRALGWLIAVLVAAGLLAGAAIGGAGWYYSGELERQGLAVRHPEPRYRLVVEDVEDGFVTLRTQDGDVPGGTWREAGLFGLQWDGGYGQVGQIDERDDGPWRQLVVLEGSLVTGTAVRVDGFAFPGDPQRAFGLAFDDIMIDGSGGRLPAWYVDGPSDTWAILVHGKNVDRREMLRTVPVLHALGLKTLVITYRNDEGAPPSRDYRVRFGATEWEDLDAAAAYAFGKGAERLVLVGNSMGGSIVMSFLLRSVRAERVLAAILDSPMLDFDETVDAAAPGAVPSLVIETGKRVASWRYGIDWQAIDYLSRADELAAPTLLFHGTADDQVPVETSDRLALARPDLVTYIRKPGVGHVRAWNADAEGYESAIRAFLLPLLESGE